MLMPEIRFSINKAVPLPALLHLLLPKHLQPLLGRSFLDSLAGVEAVDVETRFGIVVRSVSHLNVGQLRMNRFFNNHDSSEY